MSNPTLVGRIWPTALALLLMLAACAAYFAPQLSGKAIVSSDTVQNQSMHKELIDYEAETGRRSLWTNSMFGGMPAYQIYAPERGNLLRYVESAVQLGIKRPIGYFFALMVGMFVLLRVLGVNVWLSTIGAVAFGLGSNQMTLFEAGHMTKIRAIAFMAPTLAGLVVLFRGQYLVGAALFALALGLQIGANHPQMTYYLAAACGCFVVYRLIHDMGNGRLLRFGSALAISLVCAGLAVGASYSKIATTLEYGKDTMRGAPILEQAAGVEPQNSSQVEGLDWEYAMQWSNGVTDVLAGLVPGIAGGGGAVTLDKSGPVMQALRKAGQQLPPDFALPLYHGQLPFTSGPVYYGAVLVYLFILGMFWLRPGFRYFLGAAVILTLLISMGKHAEWLNRLLFDLIPYFNNFRSPSSATSVTAVLVATGALAALCQAVQKREVNPLITMRSFYIATGGTLVLLLLIAFVGPGLMDLAGSSDARLAEGGFPMDAIREERIAMLRGSAWRSLGFVAVTAGILWAWLSQKINSTVLIAAIAVLAIADVWGISRQYLGGDSWQSARQLAGLHAPRPVDEQILQDTDPHYRVYDRSVNTFNDAGPSYFHKTIGGYHAAKLQRAQDLIDYHISKGNPVVFDMLNTKYIIGGEAGKEQVQTNPNALGNAWLVKSAQVVPTANAELEGLTGLVADSVALVHQEFADRLPTTTFSGEGTVKLTSYAPDRLTYSANVNGPQLVIFSEMWYGPDKGWQVTVDGQAAEVIRANYALRALPLASGQHEIVMSFEPASFYAGETVSYIASGLILLLAVLALVYAFRQNPRRRHSTVDDDDLLVSRRTSAA